MRMRHCRPKCAGETIHGQPCKMTAALIDGELSTFCRFHDERTRAAAIGENERRKAEYWRKWRILNELAKTVPGYQQSRSPE
jgi:hypothetical protein